MEDSGKFKIAIIRVVAMFLTLFVLTLASCQVHHEIKETELKKHLSEQGYSALDLKCLFASAEYGGREACVMVSEQH